MEAALRPLTEADAPTLLAWRNSPEVARFMYTDHKISHEEHVAWLARAVSREDARYFVITAAGSEVGFASITDLDAAHGTGSWAIYLGDPLARGRGLGGFTTYSILNYAFDDLRLRKLSCEVLASNRSALGMYERFGFVREGLFREQIMKAEGAIDVHRLGILDREWAAIREGHRRRLIQNGLLKG